MQGRWKTAAARLALAAKDAVYPSAIGTDRRLSGAWRMAGPANIDLVMPLVTPDMLVTLGVEGSPPPVPPAALLPAAGSVGTLDMHLSSLARYSDVPTLQVLDGTVLFNNLSAPVSTAVTGMYIADEGLAVFIGSARPSAVSLITLSKPSGRQVQELDVGAARQRALQGSAPPAPNASNDVVVLPPSCDIAYALRYRPLQPTVPHESLDAMMRSASSRRLRSEIADDITPQAAGVERASHMTLLHSSDLPLPRKQAWLVAARHGWDALRQRTWHALQRALVGESGTHVAHGTSGAENFDHEPGAPRARELRAVRPDEVYAGVRRVSMYGKAVSMNCNFTLDVNMTMYIADVAGITGNLEWYSLIAMFAALAMVVLLSFQIVSLGGEASAARVSFAMVAMQGLIDCNLVYLHMQLIAVVPSAWISMITTIFLYGLLFMGLELRYMMAIWKAQHPEVANGGWDAMRRELGKLYLRFYAFALLPMLVLFLVPSLVKPLIFLSYSFWVPQVIHSIANDSRPGLSTSYIVGVSIARLVVPLYFFGCPTSLLYAVNVEATQADALAWADPRPSAWRGGLSAHMSVRVELRHGWSSEVSPSCSA
ncbi:hypothetical protein EON62_02305, partial [archaeon]